ncbi:MAG: sigma-54-dependent Fis family transcriptional regulator [Myxococcales bacterium]|nr:sigma-54-dependent Fis family transcriptional regulator [Myxococcales bacterium]MCB9649062.1 sigma-54-dependent Fis family transcriptional regulator [Deltaproteobacteria bacterium]
MSEGHEILVVEDEANLAELMRDVLSRDGLSVVHAATVVDAEARLAGRRYDALLLDIKLPDGDGLALLGKLRASGVHTPAVVITAFGTVDRAVQALRAGASDFLVKPFDTDRLRAAVAGALAAGARLDEVALQAGVVEPGAPEAGHIISDGGGLRDVVALLPRVAATEATVLVQGESGTGKELVARALHEASPRRDGPFVSVNCAALPATLLESELFGFERGAFTGAHAQKKGIFEAAAGGTVFLDEVGDMPLEAQAKLLRVLQEREVVRVGGRAPVAVDVRVVAATHRDLRARSAEGLFREDLMYRLEVVPIRLPALRERAADIPGLVQHFLAKHSARHGGSVPALGQAARAAALAHPWPGNVRELENWVERAVVLGRFEPPAAPGPLEPPPAPESADRVPGPRDDVPLMTLREAVAAAERAAVVAALREAEGNKAQAARLLGVSYKTLFNKIHEHGIKEARQIE